MSTNNTNTNTSALDAMMAQYQKSQENTYEKKSAFSLNNYFNTSLDKTQKTALKRVRILPTADGSSPFVEMYGHKVQVEGEWKTFACLKAEEQKDCPFCEAREALLSSGKEADKELAKKYSSKKMYVVKVIDRDNEDHGVKFWRFNHDYRKTGILDKIFAILQLAGNITSAENGRDLQVSIARDQNGNPVVQAINSFDPTPLSFDAEKVATWTNDERTWKDVYAVKPYDFLEIVVKGGVPMYDKEAKKFVDKASKDGSKPAVDTDRHDSELSMGVAANTLPSTPAPAAPVAAPASVVAPQAAPTVADEEDDLPF